MGALISPSSWFLRQISFLLYTFGFFFTIKSFFSLNGVIEVEGAGEALATSVQPSAYSVDNVVFGSPNLSAAYGRILEFADYNSDSFTDVIYEASPSKIAVHLWNPNGSVFMHDAITTVEFEGKISGVVSSDFNFDGFLDLLVLRDCSLNSQANTGTSGSVAPSQIFDLLLYIQVPSTGKLELKWTSRGAHSIHSAKSAAFDGACLKTGFPSGKRNLSKTFGHLQAISLSGQGLAATSSLHEGRMLEDSPAVLQKVEKRDKEVPYYLLEDKRSFLLEYPIISRQLMVDSPHFQADEIPTVESCEKIHCEDTVETGFVEVKSSFEEDSDVSLGNSRLQFDKEMSLEALEDGKEVDSFTTVAEFQVEEAAGDFLFDFTSIHPLLADVDNDGRMDLIAQTIKLTAEEKLERFVYFNVGEGFEAKRWSESPSVLTTQSSSTSEQTLGGSNEVGVIPSPHSSGFLDINGDCKSDLVLLVESTESPGMFELEIWLNDFSDEKYAYKRATPSNGERLNIPSNAGQMTFADFDGDGTADILIPTCKRQKNCRDCCESYDKTFIILNKRGECSNSEGVYFANVSKIPPSRMCTAMDFCLIMKSVNLTYEGVLSSHHHVPPTMRVGDYNRDGFPDLLFTTETRNGCLVNLHQNIMQEGAEPAFALVYSYYLTERSRKESCYAASFFDLFEDGTLDILGFVVNEEKTAASYKTWALKMNSSPDGLFLKAVALNGVCFRSCESNHGVPDYLPVGVSAHGPVFRVSITDMYGDRLPRMGTQLSQSAHSPLQLPFVYFGLGFINTYVEEFYLGMPLQQHTHVTYWTSIIPNTKILAIPYPLQSPQIWTLDLALGLSWKHWYILLASASFLVFVGILIFLLDSREKREDMEEVKGFRTHFIIN